MAATTGMGAFLPIVAQILLDNYLFWPKLRLPRFNDLTI